MSQQMNAIESEPNEPNQIASLWDKNQRVRLAELFREKNYLNTHPLDCPIELKKAARMAKKHLKAVFEHCDADGSGQLSRVEMVAAIQEEFELDFDNLSQELLDKLEDMYNKMDQD